MDKFELLHKYNRLVRRDLAKPLTCHRDGMEYVIRLNDGITPRLHCYGCGANYYPAEHTYEKIRKEVEAKLK